MQVEVVCGIGLLERSLKASVCVLIFDLVGKFKRRELVYPDHC